MMTLTAAIDEAGHLLYAAEVGIEIESVARDSSGDWRTNPMPTSEVTLIDTFKFQLAGMAALHAMGLASVEDIHYEDFQTVVRDMMTHPTNPVSSETAHRTARHFMDQVITKYRQPSYQDALARCAAHLQENDGISGDSVMAVARTFLP